MNIALLNNVSNAIIAAIREAPKGQRSQVTAAVITTLHEALHEDWERAQRPRPTYKTLHNIGDRLRGTLVDSPWPSDIYYRALRTDEGQIVLFSCWSKQLRETVAGLPDGTYVDVTLLEETSGRRKVYDVRIRSMEREA